ncbi:MAG TPA: GTPase domain-containing protein, partial [Kofleriaceae bacterium]
MAVLDADHNAVVIRIVYDGPPHAGKTTSLRALGRSLGRSVEAPGEIAGRTVYFDWMEYTGGLFEGQQIRCQIVSVPGQRHLAARRRALLDTADVVVFVADTSDRAAVDASVGHVRQMVDILRGLGDPPVGVVVQANKRDLPGAVPRDELRAALGEDFARTALTESIAEAGEGIRETFVLAVRLALDRIRELMAQGQLPRGRPAIDTSEQLLAALERQPAPGDIASAVMSIVPAARPRLPDARVPSGAIWPPVEGRLVLHEATAGELALHRVDSGDWLAGIGSGWRLHSAASAAFAEFDDGRQALLAWARLHAAHVELLSPSRCVVLAAADNSTWRLWQIVKLAPPLRAWLVQAAALDASELLARLATAAATLGEAHARCADNRLLPTLDTIGQGVRGAQFVALMPGPSAAPLPRPTDVGGYIARELARMLAADLVERRSELAQRVTHRGTSPTSWDDVVAAAIADRVPPPPADMAP